VVVVVEEKQIFLLSPDASGLGTFKEKAVSLAQPCRRGGMAGGSLQPPSHVTETLKPFVSCVLSSVAR